MIELCIFDMGGVYVKSFDTSRKIGEAVGIAADDYASLYEYFPGDIEKYLCGLISEEQFWADFSERTGKAVDNNPSIFGRFFHPVVDTAVDRIVRRLKNRGMRVVCGTNVVDVHYDYHLEHGQYAVFDAVYPSHLMHIAKPDPAFFRFIAEHENVSTDECFFADDSEINVRSAISTGMKGYLYRSAEALEAELGQLGLL